MPEPTILEYLAKTDDVEVKLVRLQLIIKELAKVVEIPHDFELDVQDALNEIGFLKTQLLNFQENVQNLNNVKINANFAQNIQTQLARVIQVQQTLTNQAVTTANTIVNTNQQAGNAFKNLGNQAANALNQINGPAKGFLAQLSDLNNAVRLIAFSRVAQELKSLAVEAVETSVELESLRNSFTAVLGSSEAADKALDNLRDTSQTFGRSFLDVTENFLRFKIAGDAAKLSAEGTDAIFKSIIITSSALNQSSSQLNRTFTAFEQILSKGVLSAEEIRRQLGNSLPGGFSIVARAIGVTNSELEKLLRSGTLLSTEAIPKIAAELLRTFSGQAIANVSSTRAEFARFENELLLIKQAIGDGLTPVLRDFTEEFSNLGSADNLVKLRTQSNDLALSLKAVADVLVNIASLDGAGALGGSLEVLARAGLSANDALALLAEKFGAIFSPKLAEGVRQYTAETHKSVNELIEGVKQWVHATTTGTDIAVSHNQKAAKAVAEITEQIEKLKSKNVRVLDGLLNELEAVPGETGKAAKALNDISDVLFSIQKDAKDGIFHTGESIEFAEKLETVKQQLIDAGLFTGQLAVQIVNLERGFGQATIATATFNNQLKTLGLKTPEGIEASINGLQAYIATVEEGGSVTQGQADLIVKSIKSIREEIEKLPPSQRAAFVDLERSLDSVSTKYSKFTSDAGKEADKLRKETEKAFKGLADSLGDIFDKLRDKIAGATNGDDAKKNIDDLKKELSNLEVKFNTEGLSPEELTRFNNLTAQISDAQRDAAGAIKEAFSGAQVEVAKAFEDMLLHNDKLIEGVSRLPPAAQQAFLSLVTNFDELSKAGKVTELDLEDFGKKLSGIFTGAGVNLEGFISQLSNTATLAQKLKAQISDANNENQVKHGSTSGENPAATATNEHASSLDILSQSQSQASEVLIAHNDGIIKSIENNKDASASIEQLKTEYQSLDETLRSSAATIIEKQNADRRMTEILQEVNHRQNEVEISTGDLSTAQDSLTDSTKRSSSGIAELAKETRDANQDVRDLHCQTYNFSQSLDQSGDSIDQHNEKIQQQQAAYEHAKPAIDGLRAAQDENLASATLMANAAANAGNKVKDLGDKSASASDKIDKAGPKMEEALKGLKAILGDIRIQFKGMIDEDLPTLIDLTIKWRNCANGQGTP